MPRAWILANLNELGYETWMRLLSHGETDTVFLTPEWLQEWWRIYGRGELLPVLVDEEGEPVAFAPLFIDGQMAFFVGSGGSDYLDFIGDTSDPETLPCILRTVLEQRPDLLGFHFYHIPESSRTVARLKQAAEDLSLTFCDLEQLPAPALCRFVGNELALAAEKQSLRRHQRWFEREGTLQVHHDTTSEAILPYLGTFFEQHQERWAGTGFPSLFEEDSHRRFYAALVARAPEWLRFTRVDWNDEPVAFHFGFHYRMRFLWYKPSFAIRLARHSPGEVLLRSLLLAGASEGVREFDFGLGDEAFKHRFANEVRHVRTCGLYPAGRAGVGDPQ